MARKGRNNDTWQVVQRIASREVNMHLQRPASVYLNLAERQHFNTTGNYFGYIQGYFLNAQFSRCF